MLKGDLASTPLPAVLRQLADGGATGCLHVVDPADAQAQVYLRGGLVYAVVLPGARATLDAQLVASGALTPEALSAAVEAQQRQAWRLGELLVHLVELGHVDQPVVDAVVAGRMRADVSDLLLWHDGTWRFRVNQRTHEDVAPPVEVRQLLGEVQQRRPASDELTRFGPDAVPILSAAGGTDAELVVDGDAWSLLCAVDGTRTIAELARDGGLTLAAACSVLHALVQAGLLEVEAPGSDEQDADVVRQPSVSADVAGRLASALAPAASLRGPVDDGPRHDPPPRLDRPDDAQVEHSISRVSAALSAMLGQSVLSDDLFAAPSSRRAAVPVVEPRDASRHDRGAGELAAAQAELAASRTHDTQRRALELGTEPVAEVVDLAPRREEEQARLSTAHRAEQAHQAEQARLADEAHAVDDDMADDMARASAQLQADVFAELSAAATHVPPAAVVIEPASDPAPEPAESPEPEPDVVLVDEAPARYDEGTDTAALLRELSSLGLDDDPAPPSATRPVSSTPRPSAGPPKKRKGLFGR